MITVFDREAAQAAIGAIEQARRYLTTAQQHLSSEGLEHQSSKMEEVDEIIDELLCALQEVAE